MQQALELHDAPSDASFLEENFVGTSIHWHWWGQRRQIDDDVKEVMASAVDAENDSIAATKKLYNPSLKTTDGTRPFAALQSLKTKVKKFWQSVTLPYPQNNIRLLKLADQTTFRSTMQEFAKQVQDSASIVQRYRDEIIIDARRRLSGAFDPNEYDIDLSQNYSLEWSFPSLKPAENLSPEIYEEERRRARRRLDETIQLFEANCLQMLADLTAGLREKLTPEADGKKKIFRDSAVDAIKEFISYFESMNVSNNQQLQAAVLQTKSILAGIDAQDLRDSQQLRSDIAKELEQVHQQTASLVITAPRRKLIRPFRKGAA